MRRFMVPVGITLLLAAFGVSTAPCAPLPIVLTGYNRDVVSDATAAVRFADRFDGGAAAWFERGLDDGGTIRNDGLPSGTTFTSARVNPVTGGNTVFSLQPAMGNNVLRLGDTDAKSNTLTLTTPSRYANLAILASSGSGGGQGTFKLNFDDGTSSQLILFDAFDWNQETPGAGPSVALGNLGRNGNIGVDGKGFVYDKPVPFALYETDINLIPLGLSDKTITSITFNKPDGSFITGIFAVSGTVPEPGSLALCGAGLVGLLAYGWRRRRSAARG